MDLNSKFNNDNSYHMSMSNTEQLHSAAGTDLTTMKKAENPQACFGTRHVLAILGFFGFWNIYSLRVNLSVALVAMVNSSSLAGGDNNTSNECLVTDTSDEATSTTSEGEFEWDEYTQGIIQSSFYWGYVVTQIPGGVLAEKWGGKMLFGVGVLITAAVSLLTPVVARAGINYLIAIRILAGLGEGATYPAIHELLSKWAPPVERSKIGSFVYAGAQMGTAFGLVVSGVLVEHNFAGGWPSIFYVTGAIGVLWFILWMLLVFNSPAKHPRISLEEKIYIETSLGQTNPTQRPAVPWRHVLTSVPVWALVICHMGQNWGFFTMLHELPTYMKNILHFDISQNSLLSALPYLVMWPSSVLSSFVADWLLDKKYLSTAVIRKLFNSLGFLTPAAAMVGASFTGCDRVATVALLTAAVGLNGMVYSGFLVNHIDLSTNYAGTLMGITNCAANISSILAPYVCGLLISGNQNLASWQNVFFIAAGIYLVTDLIFVVFGKGVEQPWNTFSKDTQKKTMQVSTVSGYENMACEIKVPIVEELSDHQKPVTSTGTTTAF